MSGWSRKIATMVIAENRDVLSYPVYPRVVPDQIRPFCVTRSAYNTNRNIELYQLCYN